MTSTSNTAYENASARRRAAVRVSSHKTRVSEMRDGAVRAARFPREATPRTDRPIAARSGYSGRSQPSD
jgi:hypothetical protein